MLSYNKLINLTLNVADYGSGSCGFCDTPEYPQVQKFAKAIRSNNSLTYLNVSNTCCGVSDEIIKSMLTPNIIKFGITTGHTDWLKENNTVKIFFYDHTEKILDWYWDLFEALKSNNTLTEIYSNSSEDRPYDDDIGEILNRNKLVKGARKPKKIS